MPFVYFGHMLHKALTNLHCVSVENFISLWDYRKCLLINWRKIFAMFEDIALLNGELSQIIFQDLFFSFCHWFLVYLKLTLNPVFFRASLYLHFAVLNISLLSKFLTVSLGWNLEFALWRLVAGLINYECKEAYHLAFRKDNKFHFTN